MANADPVTFALDRAYRGEHGKIVAVLARAFGSLDRAEDLVQAAYLRAGSAWRERGVPTNPGAWLTTVAKRLAIDEVRKSQSRGRSDEEIRRDTASGYDPIGGRDRSAEGDPYELLDRWPDDRLRLVFACCHPSLSADARVALTLREVCGLTTEEIARGFLVPTGAMAQRLVRAKRLVRATGIRFEIPEGPEIIERLDSVLAVVYLVFNEGYSATSGEELTRSSLCEEAIFLSGMVSQLLAQRGVSSSELEALGALLAFSHARSDARVGPAGGSVPLSEQDRNLWNSSLIAEAKSLLDRAESLAATGGNPGPYLLKARIQEAHTRDEGSDWDAIAGCYDELVEVEPTAIVALNRAVALGFASGADAGLDALEGIDLDDVANYPYFFATRAHFLALRGDCAAAERDYHAAIVRTENEVERRFLTSKLEELRAGSHGSG